MPALPLIDAKNYPRPTISGVVKSARNAEKLVVLFTPEGVAETHMRSNARDLIRLRNYTAHDPSAAAAKPGTNPDALIPADEDAVKTDQVEEAKEQLTLLRMQLAGLGVEVDNRWGIRRLNDEIAQAQDDHARKARVVVVETDESTV